MNPNLPPAGYRPPQQHGAWEPGDPIYERPISHVACCCGVQVLAFDGLPEVCPECGGPMAAVPL